MLKRISLLTCAVICAFGLVLGWTCYNVFDGAETRREHEQLESIGKQFQVGLSSSGRMAMAQADIIAGLPGLVQGIEKSDPQEILSRILPNYDLLKNQFGLDILQAVNNNNKLIARASNPASFGEDFSKFRPMIVEANVTQQAVNGLEMGGTGLRMRAIVPVVSNGQKVGVFEVGQKLDRTLEVLRQNFGVEIALLLNATALANIRPNTMRDRREVFHGMSAEQTTDLALLTGIAKEMTFAQVKEPTFKVVNVNSGVYKVMQMPFSDYAGRPIGNFMTMKDIGESERRKRQVLLQVMGIAAAGSIVMCGLVLVMFRGLVLRPVTAAATSAEAIADGKSPQALPARNGDDAVARLMRALERIRLRHADEGGAKAS